MKAAPFRLAAPWRQDFEAELLRFPAGMHDDQVDALGLEGQMLDTVRPGRAPAPLAKPAGGMPGYRSTRSAGQSWRLA